jgi:hypothetical protein
MSFLKRLFGQKKNGETAAEDDYSVANAHLAMLSRPRLTRPCMGSELDTLSPILEAYSSLEFRLASEALPMNKRVSLLRSVAQHGASIEKRLGVEQMERWRSRRLLPGSSSPSVAEPSLTSTGYVARMKRNGRYTYFDPRSQETVSHPKQLSGCFKDEGTARGLLAKVLTRAAAEGVVIDGSVMTLERAIQEHVDFAASGEATSVDYVVRLKFGAIFMYFDPGTMKLVSHPRNLSATFKEERFAKEVLSDAQSVGAAGDAGEVMPLEQAIREHG